MAVACSGPPSAIGDPDATERPDAQELDAPAADAAMPDAATPDAMAARKLSDMGLYADINTKELAPGIVTYRPAHELWSDAAEKNRWIWLPPDTTINSADMDHWVLPVGTRLYKEFRVGDKRVETRVIIRTGTAPEDYWMGAFVWNSDESEAVFAEYGVRDANGTDHDVPSANKCWECHSGEPGRILGFSAIQLSDDATGLTLPELVAQDLLSNPPPADVTYPAPGPDATAEALGYLHANCGHCHNPVGRVWDSVAMNLRLSVSEKTPEQTAIYETAVGAPLEYWIEPPFTYRIVPGDAANSAIWYRMSVRDIGRSQMPPLATEVVDERGVDVVAGWINSLPRD